MAELEVVTWEYVERLKARASAIQHEMRAGERELGKLHRHAMWLDITDSYLAVNLHARKLIDRVLVWRPGGALIIGTLAGSLTFLFTRDASPALATAICSGLATIMLLNLPSDASAAEVLDSNRQERSDLRLTKRDLEWKIAEWRREHDEVTTDSRRLTRQLQADELRRSRRFQLQQLCNSDWKSLRSVPFEQFLEQVFTILGYQVETTRVTGDQGVDLIVSKNGFRIAIQVKGYFNSVSNSAVQEAHAGKSFYQCHGSAVITNSRFTASARELAAGVGCMLIDEHTLPALILGEIDLLDISISSLTQVHSVRGG